MIPELNPIKIKRAIENLENSDLQKIKISELEVLLIPLFSGYKINVPRFEAGVYLYRGRKCEKPSSLDQVYYPKPEYIKKIGRINHIEQPFFYATAARSVPFFELDVKNGDLIAIACWKTTKQMLLNHVGFTKECKLDLSANRDLTSIYEFIKNMQQFDDKNKIVENYLASKFTEKVSPPNEYKFKMTIAIAKKLLNGNLIDGIMYPTIAMSGNADNIALKPQYADTNLKFVSVEFFRITDRKGTLISFDVLDSATTVNSKNEFNWSGRGLQWKIQEDGGELQMKDEGAGWIAYDKNGIRVDPI